MGETDFPNNWTLSKSWQRAQKNELQGEPINKAEWSIKLPDGERHRVEFAIRRGRLVWDCDCDGHHYRGFCAHVAHLWWSWVRGRADVTDLDTDTILQTPPAWLRVE